jgi:hypothetical protein
MPLVVAAHLREWVILVGGDSRRRSFWHLSANKEAPDGLQGGSALYAQLASFASCSAGYIRSTVPPGWRLHHLRSQPRAPRDGGS